MRFQILDFHSRAPGRRSYDDGNVLTIHEE